MSKNPMISILMGSKSDDDHMAAAYALLDEFGVAWEKRVLSAHRQPDKLRAYLLEAEKSGIRIFIAAAGLSAALPGVVAAHTTRPVIGVPVPGGPLKGVDALLSIVQMPGGIPVATVGVGSHGPKNAAILAVEMLALADADIAGRLRTYRDKLAEG
jgi:phosphoribosylaminoimidazole carboxylase PurE protein